MSYPSSDAALYDPEPPDSYVLTLPELGAAVVLVLGAAAAGLAWVMWRRWSP